VLWCGVLCCVVLQRHRLISVVFLVQPLVLPPKPADKKNWI
jgi:hypothetical protein